MAIGRRTHHHLLVNARNTGDFSEIIDCQFDGTRTYTASMEASGVAKGTVTFYGSTVMHTGFEVIGTLDLSATNATDSGSFPGEVPWNYIKATLTSAEGNARFDAWLGI